MNKNVASLSSSLNIFFNLTRHMPPTSHTIISTITQVSLFSAKYCHLIQMKYRDLHPGVN